MELITGVGATDHIDSQDDADFQRAITGQDNYVLNIGRKMEAELLSNNVVRVHDGSLIHQGRHVIIPEGESEEVTIEYGTQGEKRIDLIVSVYSKDTTSGIETEFLKAINGTPSVDSPAIPSHIDGNIRAGDIYSEFPLYKVTLDGINIVSIDPLYEVLTSMAELKTMTDELNRNLEATKNNLSCLQVLECGSKIITTPDGLYVLKGDLPEDRNYVAHVINGDYNANSAKIEKVIIQDNNVVVQFVGAVNNPFRLNYVIFSVP